MYFVEGRIQRILEELNKLKYWYSERVEEIYVGYGEPLISKNLSGAEKEWMLLTSQVLHGVDLEEENTQHLNFR